MQIAILRHVEGCLATVRIFASALWVAIALLFLASPLRAQTTIDTGSIVGIVSDVSGSVMSGASLSIINTATGRAIVLTTNSSGAFNSGALIPGNYRAQVSAEGFAPVAVPVIVLVGNTASVNIVLRVGEQKTVIEVQADLASVNTEQPTVQGVLSEQQIESLPLSGRNFLDLAQLEPGVQMQDAGSFGFGFKDGYSSISFGGRFGRAARIEVDGIDISDERFGSSTMNIPASAIQEFQLSQASLDLSTELTTSGAVNVITRSGSNGVHGEGFGFFRDSSLAAALPAPPGLREPFQRSQFGGRVGGPVVKNKLFYLLDGEHTLQHLQAPVLVLPPFEQFSGGFSAPFHETNILAKADRQFAHSSHAFYRFGYFQDSFTSNGGAGLSLYRGKNITRTHGAGVDFMRAGFSHSLRVGYLKTERSLTDGTAGSGLPLANFPLNIQIGFGGLDTGPSPNARLVFRQSNHQAKYDGSNAFGLHVVRFGFNFDRIASASFVPFGSLAPLVFASDGLQEEAFAQTGPFAGGNANPLNYPVEFVQLANGLGYITPKPGLGLPAGNFLYHRLAAYLGANSKWKRNLSLTYGVRYVRETGRSDSEFAPIPELNMLFPGLGNRVRQPNLNFAPQLGFAWDPTGKGKTAIRGGVGLLYENVLTSVDPQDPIFRSPLGDVFNQTPLACNGTATPLPVPIPGGALQPTFCGTAAGGPVAIGIVANQIAALQKQYQSAFQFDLHVKNPNYLGFLLAQGQGLSAAPLAPDYRTPRAVEMNIGVQREIRPGMLLSADFVRNVQTHYFIAIDENHAGDARFFDKRAALEAIAATNQFFGCGIGTDSNSIDCAIRAGAQIADYAGNGLTSSADLNAVCSFPSAMVPGGTYGCAFPGVNPKAPPLNFFEPIGRSVYNGLQIKLTQSVQMPFRGLRALNLQVSYALSKFANSGGAFPAVPVNSDQDFGIGALDNARPNRFFGPSVLDRTHQLSFGGYFDLPGGFQLGIVSHFWSPLSTSLVVPSTNLGPGEMFRTDFTGDGTSQDIIPGTHVGSFERGIRAANLNKVLANYNITTALNLTPAGQVLVQNGLFSAAQLGVGNSLCYKNPDNLPVNSLCAVAPPVPLAPAGQVDLAWLRAFDLRVAWSHKIGEKLTVQPSAAFFNLLNFANFDLPGNALAGVLAGVPGLINGTTRPDHIVNRVGVGTGVYSLGAPRQTEFGLRITF